ncbi:hypothetical protein ACJX0J_008416 [Zea mays]
MPRRRSQLFKGLANLLPDLVEFGAVMEYMYAKLHAIFIMEKKHLCLTQGNMEDLHNIPENNHRFSPKLYDLRVPFVVVFLFTEIYVTKGVFAKPFELSQTILK